MDNLSEVHHRTVWAEIQGRFFSKEEADDLKAEIDRHTITDPATRALGAKAWGSGDSQGVTSDDGRT